MTRFLKRSFQLMAAFGLILSVTGQPAAWADDRDRGRDGDDNVDRGNMELVGVNDLQARSTYQPTLHQYSNGRYILFTGHHALGLQGEGLLPGAVTLPSFNPLTGKNELNGTSIVDVSNPRNPKLPFSLPGSDGVAGGAQMVRMCDGDTLPIHDNKVYMLRTYANSAHEIWDVTNPSSPLGVRTVAGGNPVIGAQTGTPGAMAGTHKSWWECDTGVAYVVGRRGNDTADGWRSGNHIFIFDISNPATPVFLRDWALDGQQPGGVIPPHFTAPDFVTDTGNDDGNTMGDFVVVTSEAGGAFCNEFRHLTFMTDVTNEGRPQSVATAQVPASEGGFCDKGGRFGPHATNEEFGPPFYQKLVFVSYFNAGVRAFHVRDPYNPTNVAFFIPRATSNTDFRCGPYQGNPNV